MTTIYDVIRRPLVTEKSNYQSSKLHQYSFEVTSDATRTLVKDAIETLFDVKVVTCEYHEYGCQAQPPPQPPPAVRAPGIKKAIVTLAEGSTLEIFEGVK